MEEGRGVNRMVGIFLHICHRILFLYFQQYRWVREEKESDIDRRQKSEERLNRERWYILRVRYLEEIVAGC